MTKNPFYNAGLALLYNVFVVSVMNYGSRWAQNNQDNASIVMPVGMLSLFVLSASVMGYLLLSQPLMMYWDNQRKEAVSLFLRTIAVFAVATAIILIASVTLFR